MAKPPSNITHTAKTPEELAKPDDGKDKFTLYLNVSNMEYIKNSAGKAGTSTSKIVDEAIAFYIATIRTKK